MTDAELRQRVDAALSEIGYGGKIRPPGLGAPEGTRFVCTKGAVPVEVIWKALALISFQRSPSTPVKCPRHARNLPGDEACRRYPVGAMLAGVIGGCQ